MPPCRRRSHLNWRLQLREPPYSTVLKPYGAALVELARQRPEIICLGADLTRQTETDLFRDEIADRFINLGMAEANMISIAGGLARAGRVVFVNTFGVFCTRRCFDQIAMSVAYPNLNVKIVGFMPGLSSPGGPSHQAIEDVALMRALPNMTVVEPADAIETKQAVAADRGASGAGLSAAQARRDTGDLRRQPPPRSAPGASAHRRRRVRSLHCRLGHDATRGACGGAYAGREWCDREPCSTCR